MTFRPRGRLAALVVGMALAAPAPLATQTTARYADRAQLMRDVTTLAGAAFEGRRAGTPGGARARAWIVEQFGAIGLTPTGDAGYVQPFSLVDGGARSAAGNVVGRLAGRSPHAKTLVVTAHYDHLGIRDGRIYHGADDNASGVAALLAAARHFRANPPRHPLVFAALDAEEGGRDRQNGAGTLVESLPRGTVALNVNLDMVSRSEANEIYAAGTYHYPWLRPHLEDVRARASVTLLFGHDRPAPLAGGLEDWTLESDHAEFHRAGIPFVYFGVEDHPDYHQPTDTADKIDVRFFGDVADLIVEALRAFDARLE